MDGRSGLVTRVTVNSGGIRRWDANRRGRDDRRPRDRDPELAEWATTPTR